MRVKEKLGWLTSTWTPWVWKVTMFGRLFGEYLKNSWSFLYHWNFKKFHFILFIYASYLLASSTAPSTSKACRPPTYAQKIRFWFPQCIRPLSNYKFRASLKTTFTNRYWHSRPTDCPIMATDGTVTFSSRMPTVISTPSRIRDHYNNYHQGNKFYVQMTIFDAPICQVHD